MNPGGVPGGVGGFFDGRGNRVGTDPNGSVDGRKYLVSSGGIDFIRSHGGIATVSDINAGGGTTYELRGSYASYQTIDDLFEGRAEEKQESHAALTLDATNSDVSTDFETVEAERSARYNVTRTYTQSDFAMIASQSGPNSSLVFVAHDHPPNRDVESSPLIMENQMNNPTGYNFSQGSLRGDDYSAVADANNLANREGIIRHSASYGVLFGMGSDALVFYNQGGREQQVSTTMRTTRSILDQ